MKKILFLLTLVLLSCKGMAQTTASDKNTQNILAVEYEKAKNSISYLQAQKTFNLLMEKWFPEDVPEFSEDFTSNDKFLAWIKENLDKTAFKDYEEAEKCFNEAIQANAIFLKENKAYIDAWLNASEEEQEKYILF